MPDPRSCKSRQPASSATPSASSSSRSALALQVASWALPFLALALYARSFWGSPAFAELADQGYHLELGRAFADAWRAGDFPPTWSATANGGRGSPAFLLYPPLFPWLTACWMRLTPSSQEALRHASLTAALFNLLAIYWAARAWLSPARASVAAGLTLLLPGVTFVGLARGMFPNFLALAWIALAVGAAQRASARPRHIGSVALAGAGLILTHGPSAYLAALAGATLALAAGRTLLLRCALGGAFALLITAWFWVPMLHTARHAQTAYLVESHPYAASLWGTVTAPANPFERDWAFLNETASILGVAQALLAVLLATMLAPGLGRRSLTLLTAWCLAASLPPTGAWLTALPGYENVQFCWRWQPLLSLGCALAYASLPVRNALRLSPLLGGMILLFLPLAWPSTQTPGKADTASNLIEMRPLGASRELFRSSPPGRIEVIEGGCEAVPASVQPSRRTYRLRSRAPCRLRLLTYHFPGWTASADGAPTTIAAEPGTAFQTVEVPAGARKLEVLWRPRKLLDKSIID